MNIASYLKNRQLCVLSVGIAYLLFFFTTLRRSDRKSPDYESSQDENPGKGVVTDKSGEPLIGATIVEKASGNGMIADPDGNFNLAVSSDAVLEISFIGYKSQQIQVNGKTTFSIVLEEDAENLEEVVVVGYGVQRKVNLSGSVDQINAKQLEAVRSPIYPKGLARNGPELEHRFHQW